MHEHTERNVQSEVSVDAISHFHRNQRIETEIEQGLFHIDLSRQRSHRRRQLVANVGLQQRRKYRGVGFEYLADARAHRGAIRLGPGLAGQTTETSRNARTYQSQELSPVELRDCDLHRIDGHELVEGVEHLGRPDGLDAEPIELLGSLGLFAT